MSAPTFDLGTMHGGLRLPAEKQASTSTPILEIPVPGVLVVPLEQHAGAPSRPTVAVGDTVLRGQVIAAANAAVGVPVHAPSSGRVVGIEDRPVARRRGDAAPCIVIECDGADRPCTTTRHDDYLAMSCRLRTCCRTFSTGASSGSAAPCSPPPRSSCRQRPPRSNAWSSMASSANPASVVTIC